jgi:chromosome segregation ATPase
MAGGSAAALSPAARKTPSLQVNESLTNQDVASPRIGTRVRKVAVELQGIDRAGLVTLLREAAADIMAAHARADANQELADALQELRAQLEERIKKSQAQADGAEQRAATAEEALSLIQERLGTSQDRAEQAEARALAAQQANEENIARAKAAEARAQILEKTAGQRANMAEARVRDLEDRLDRARAALEADVDEPSLDALVGFVAGAMSETQAGHAELQNAA